MSSINGVGNPEASGPPQKIIHSPIQKEIPATAAQPRSIVDKLELSGMSHLLQALKSDKDVRLNRIQQIKTLIESGNYPDDDQKLDLAAERLLDELLTEPPTPHSAA